MKTYDQAKSDAKKKLSHYFSQFEVLGHENISEIESIIDEIEYMIEAKLSDLKGKV